MTINIILYFLAVYGITFMLVYSNGPFHIFLKLRERLGNIHPQFQELLSCCFCTPTNIGWILSLIDTFILTSVSITPFNILWASSGVGWFVIMVFDMVITGAVVYLIDTIQTFFEEKDNGTITF